MKKGQKTMEITLQDEENKLKELVELIKKPRGEGRERVKN